MAENDSFALSFEDYLSDVRETERHEDEQAPPVALPGEEDAGLEPGADGQPVDSAEIANDPAAAQRAMFGEAAPEATKTTAAGVARAVVEGAAEGSRQTFLALGVPDGVPYLTADFERDEEAGDTFVEGAAHGFGQFMPLFVPAFAGLKYLGLTSSAARGFVAGGVSDALSFDPLEARLSNFLEETTGAPAWLFPLSAEEDDSALEGRLKNFMEGGILGESAGFILQSLRPTLRRIVKMAKPRERLVQSILDGELVPDAKAADRVASAADKVEVLENSKAELQQVLDADGVRAESALDRLAASNPEVIDGIRTHVEDSVAQIDEALPEARMELTGAEEQLELSLPGMPPGYAREVVDALDDGSEAAVRRREMLSGMEDRLRVADDQERLLSFDEAVGRAVGESPVHFEEMVDAVYDNTDWNHVADAEEVMNSLQAAAGHYARDVNSARLLGIERFPTTEAKMQGLLEIEGNTIGASPAKVQAALDKLIPGTQNLAAKILSIRVYEASLARRLNVLGEGIVAGQGTQAGKAAMAEWVQTLQMLANVNDARAGIVGEVGRALSAQRITARSFAMDNVIPKQEMDALLQRVLAEGGGEDAIFKAATEYKKVARAGAKARSRFARKQIGRGRRLGNMAIEAWLNGLLSGPITHAVNFTSNSFNMLYLPTETLLEGAIRFDTRLMREAVDMYVGMAELARDHLYLTGHVLSEDVAYAAGKATRGDFKGARAAMRRGLERGNVGKAFLTGDLQSVPDSFRQFDVDVRGQQGANRAISGENWMRTFKDTRLESAATLSARFVDFTGAVVNLPSRFLTTADDFAKGMNYRAMSYRVARREARRLGLSGQGMTDFVQKAVDDAPHFADMPGVDPARLEFLKQLDAQAKQHARYATFTDALHQGSISNFIQRGVNEHPILRLLFPFIRTPTNLMKFAGQRLPGVGFASREMREMLADGRTGEALARQGAGMMFWMTAMLMAANDQITGGGPTNPAERKAWLDAGNQPYSFKFTVGDETHFLSFNRSDPHGQFFGLAGDISAIAGNVNEEERQHLALAAVAALAKNLTSKTYFTGLAEAVKALSSPERFLAIYFQKQTGSLVPNFFAQTNRSSGLDPHLREVDAGGEGSWRELQGVVNAMKARIPGLSSTLPPRRNIFGEPVTPPPGVGPDIISPFYHQTQNSDPINKEITRLSRIGPGIRLTMSRSFATIGTGETQVRLTAEQRDEFIVYAAGGRAGGGRTLREELNAFVSSSEYQKLGDPFGDFEGGKIEKIKEIIARRRETAENWLLAKYDGTDTDLRAMRNERRAVAAASVAAGQGQQLLDRLGITRNQ